MPPYWCIYSGVYPGYASLRVYEVVYTQVCFPEGVCRWGIPGYASLGMSPWVYRTAGYCPACTYGRMGGIPRRRRPPFSQGREGPLCAEYYSSLRASRLRREVSLGPQPPYYPFHCWSIVLTLSLIPVSLLGLFPAGLVHRCPFHCWVYSRFTVGRCLFPLSRFTVGRIPHVPAP